MMAHNIDFVIYLTVALLLRQFIDTASTMYSTLGLFIVFYEICFLISPWHATPGKKYMRIKVVSHTGNDIRWFQTVLRTLLKIPSLLLLFTGYALINYRTDKRALHDLLASTQVIHV